MIGQTRDIKLIAHFYIYEIWKRRWIAMGVAWLVAFAGLFHVASLPDQYSSSARVYVDTDTLLNPLMSGLAVSQNTAAQIDFMRRTLLTRPNMEQIITGTNLDLSITTLDPQQRVIERERLIDDVRRRIAVRSEGPNLFRISFRDSSPDVARDVAEAVLSLFREQNISDKREDLIQSRRFIDRQIATYEELLSQNERRVADFRRENSEALRKGNRAKSRIGQIESELQRLTTERQSAVWNRDQLQTRLETTPQYLDENGFASFTASQQSESQCLELEQNRRIMLTSMTPEHPDVRNLDRVLQAYGCFGDAPTVFDIEAEQAALAARAEAQTAGENGPAMNPEYLAIKDTVEQLDMVLERTDQRMNALQQELRESIERSEEVPEVQLRLAQLNRDYDAIRNTYNELIDRRESARLAQNLEDQSTSVQVRVVEPPVRPAEPSGPDRLGMSLMVMIASLGAGVGAAFGLIHLNDSFRTV